MTLLSRRLAVTFLLAASFAPSSAQVISTIAGGGYNNIPATSAGISPFQLATDNSGDVFFPAGQQLYKITSSGKIFVFAGNGAGASQFSGEGGPAVNATLVSLSSVTIDGRGNVYIGDNSLFTIWKIDAITGKIDTLVRLQGFAPTRMAADRSGNLFIASQTECPPVDRHSSRIAWGAHFSLTGG